MFEAESLTFFKVYSGYQNWKDIQVGWVPNAPFYLASEHRIPDSKPGSNSMSSSTFQTLESHLSSLSHEENNTSRLASKYLALSHENEQLRFKLKEQEIQLEGTKAKLRILEKNNSAATTLSLSSIIKPSSCPPDPFPRFSRHHQHQLQLLHSSSNSSSSPNLKSPTSPTITSKITKGSDISHQLDLDLDSSSSPTQESPSHPPNNNNGIFLNSHPPVVVSKCPPEPLHKPPRDRAASCRNSTTKLALLHEHPTAVVKTLSRSSSSVSSRSVRPMMMSKIPTTLRPQTPRKVNNGHGHNGSTSSTLSSNSISPPPSKSPGSSISSKSSIPIAVSRLRRNPQTSANSSSNNNSSNSKRQGSNFWTNWFAS